MTNGFMSVKTDDVELDTPALDPASATHEHDPNENKEVKTTDTWAKRYADQQKYVTKLQQEISTLKDEVKGLKSKPLELPTTVEELERFKKDHPGLANSIISLARLEVSERDKDLTERLKEIDDKAAAVDAANKLAQVLKVHPDAKKIKESVEFAEWYETQSAGTQSLLKSTDPRDWVRGITIYKEDMGIKTVKTKKEEAASAVTTTSAPDTKVDMDKKVWKASEVNAMSDEQYNLNRDKIVKAKIDGRYINDISR